MMITFSLLSREESIFIYKQISPIIVLPPSDKLLQSPEQEFPFCPSIRDLRVVTYDDEILFPNEGGKFSDIPHPCRQI
jgi:hypothetical protein